MNDVLQDLRIAKEGQARAASRRYGENREDREANARQRKAENRTVLDSPDQLEVRARRLVGSSGIEAERVFSIMIEEQQDLPAVLERIMETSDLQSVSFLARGVRAARPVARICLFQGGRECALGTGFLVSPRLLMTNNHVLPNEEIASAVSVEFGYELGIDQVSGASSACALDPATFFVTDPHLDFTLVLVKPGADGRPPGEEFGWNRLIRQQGKIVIGEPVNVIGHPKGRRKEIAIRNNSLEYQVDHFLHYHTDTEPGNSGSPVFNDQWEVVALHHAGVGRKDEQGRYFHRDGRLWRPEDGDDAIDWIGNEGTRISVILAHLARLDWDAPRRAILAEGGIETGSANAGMAVVETHAERRESPMRPAAAVAVPTVEAASPRSGLAARAGAFGGNTHMLFLHGRRQEGQDPERLRHMWTAGLNAGLTLSNLPRVDPQDVWFPFYGNQFVAALGARESVAAPASLEALVADPAEALAPAEPSTRTVYEELIAEAAEKGGLPPLEAPLAGREVEGLVGFGASLVGGLQSQLSWLANRSGLDAALIASLFRDVAAYLDRSEVRQAVLDCVRETLPASGRLVLVSHSLGTIVALDLIHELSPQLEVVQLVTAGSPLGMDTVFSRLLSRGPHRPARVRHWLNAWCAPDAVAIGCPLRDDWDGQLQEVVTNNLKERAHSIEEYLSNATVARTIGGALIRG